MILHPFQVDILLGRAGIMSGTASIQQAVLELVSLHTDFTQLIAEVSKVKYALSRSSEVVTSGLLHAVVFSVQLSRVESDLKGSIQCLN